MAKNRFIGEGLFGIRFGSSQCPDCRHSFLDWQYCEAFPEGITIDIISGEVKHTQPIEGDNGIQFEAREG